jgi:hypothetical protein
MIDKKSEAIMLTCNIKGGTHENQIVPLLNWKALDRHQF